MKKMLCVACAMLMAFSLAACNSSEPEPSPSEGTSENVSESPSEQQTTAQQESGGEFVSLAGRPVDAASDMLIVQDPENQQYGLYTAAGEEILPCEYGDMQFITVNTYEPKTYVAVQSKGSYGVCDLSGAEIVAPEYDRVSGAEYADCILVERADSMGAVDLQGNEILPAQYTNIACSPKGTLVAATDGEDTLVEFYTVDGSLQSSFQDNVNASSIYFYNWGEILTFGGSYSDGARRTLSGDEWNGMLTPFSENGYFGYRHGTTLSFMDGSTGKELTSVDLGYNADYVLLSGEWYDDAANGNTVCYFYCQPFDENVKTLTALADPVYYLAVLNETSSSINQVDKYEDVGPFYNGSAFAVQDDRLFALDTSGNAAELSAPFHASSDAYFLYEDCAILNNNGYIYAVDKNGNEILSENGYTDVDWTYDRGEGLIVLTASDGTTQVIDTYGNEVVPQGNSYQQAVVYDAQGEDTEIYSLIHDMTSNKYIFTDNENLRAFETHSEMNEDFAEKLFAGQGWVLWDETEQKLIGVVSSESGYQICDAAGPSK